MKPVVAALGTMALGAVLVAGVLGTVASADKGRKNEGWVSPRFAEYGVTRIGFAGFGSVERDIANDKVFKEELERGFAATKYRFQGLSAFQDMARLGQVEGAVAALQRSSLADAPPDSAAVAQIQGKLSVDAMLFVNVTRMERNLIDVDTRGQASTDVGAEFALVAVKDGAMLWRGNFADRGLGPYNEPNVADVGQRDPTGNAQPRLGSLDPPDFPDVVNKLMRTVTASLPAPAAKPTAATTAQAPPATATPEPATTSH